MAEDHDMRVECAGEFATIKGQIQRVANGRVDAMDQIGKLTGAIAGYQTENRLAHEDIKTGLNDHLVQTEGRLSTLEGSSRSAHKRLDFLQGKFWWAIGLIVSGTVGAVVTHVAGVW